MVALLFARESWNIGGHMMGTGLGDTLVCKVSRFAVPSVVAIAEPEDLPAGSIPLQLSPVGLQGSDGRC